MYGPREVRHIAAHPLPGDVVELHEGGPDPGDTMLRVLAVVEEHVGFKEYGKGRFWSHLPAWKARLERAQTAKVIHPADADCPF